MSRFKYILDKNENTDTGEKKLVGIFPFNTMIDIDSTDVSKGQLGFLDVALDGLKLLAEKNYAVILFINQFKTKPLAYESFQSMNATIENTIRNQKITLAGLYWCPTSDKNDPYVTPNAGMFMKATENQGIVWANTPVLATADADLKAANKIGANGVKIGRHSEYKTVLDWAKSL